MYAELLCIVVHTLVADCAPFSVFGTEMCIGKHGTENVLQHQFHGDGDLVSDSVCATVCTCSASPKSVQAHSSYHDTFSPAKQSLQTPNPKVKYLISKRINLCQQNLGSIPLGAAL